MSRWIAVYGVYFVNTDRTEGYSAFFDNWQDARNNLYNINTGWSGRTTEQTYEVVD